ncbi:integrin alpha-PS3-like [Anopheles nili]|uniref:integrin alpha-PS3-like n=1 Tax=Anopheles nili TaxID=185578 RepID=UPI00237AF441|nr:integrin alpha-PS3-like [Anopheles nili]
MLVLMIFKCVCIVAGFNLSPEPNYVFKLPTLNTFIRPVRSSHFGYSVNLRKTGVIVGAPQAQSDLEYQRRINETGAIFRCSFLSRNVTNACEPIRLDRQGNTYYEGETFSSHREIRSENKEYQQLGATVDGLGSDGAWLVTCAPHLKGSFAGIYLLHGVCYLTEGIDEIEEPKNLYKIKPLRLKARQRSPRNNYNYLYGEQGFSLHVTDDGTEVLIGAPGIMDWRGTVLRYRQRPTFGFAPSEVNGNVFRDTLWRRRITHETVVPDPVHSNVPHNAYFGYAVSSGRFLGTQQMLYVASAPQARGQHGEVLLFDYADNETLHETVILRYRTFVGEQLGEYFGYALLTEDFNGDGLPDLAIGAPMHSRTREHDNGAVYIQLNAGELSFELQGKLTSAYELGGRFGTSLGRIGDLNGDGFGDIAIGAPFEGDGVVYVFLGSPSGVQPRPSQRLVPSMVGSSPPTYTPRMFGHALSRGVDIDGNGYPDLAVGAPNEESVYVFRAYPIVHVEARINASKRELPAEDAALKIGLCWSASFPSGAPFQVALQYSMVVDVQMGRAVVKNHRRLPSITVSNDPVCLQYDVQIVASPTTLYQPLTIDLEFGIATKATPTKGQGFCNHCAMLDPAVVTHVQERIPFKTGCRKETCETDLKIVSLRWVDVTPPYVIGSSKRATLEVQISNTGENAYLPQVNFTVPVALRLESVPSECQLTDPVHERAGVLCELNHGLPLKFSTRLRYSLTFDMTQLQATGSSVTIHARALTTSRELWPADNELHTTLALREFSHVEIVSKSTSREANFENQKRLLDVTQLVQLYNNGPSTLNEALFRLDVPLSYTPEKLLHTGSCRIMQLNDINVRSSYNDTPLDVFWLLDDSDKGLLRQTSEFYVPSRSAKPLPSGQNGSIVPSDSVVLPEWKEYEHEETDFSDSTAIARRKRSNLWVHPARPNSSTLHLDELPAGRTVYFNCAWNLSRVECLQLQLKLPAFFSGHRPITVELQYKLDLDAIEPCLQDHEDIIVVQIANDLWRPTDELEETFRVARKNSHTIIYRDANISTPIYIYVTSTFGGLLLLAAITYTMYRGGFFDRHMKKELETLHREVG